MKKRWTVGVLTSWLAFASPVVLAEVGEAEKEDLKFGFIKLTDMAPLAIAYEKGFFEDEGLYVTLEAQANWKVLLDRVIDGELDGAHMLAGQPLGATIGIGTQAKVITAFSMDLNGNAITVSNDVWQQMKPNLVKDSDGKPVHPIKADALKPVVTSYRDQGKAFNMGMVFPVSTHNYELRYWLAAGGFILAIMRRIKATTVAKLMPTCCSASRRHHKCQPPWKRAPSKAIALVNRGTSKRCLRALVCPW